MSNEREVRRALAIPPAPCVETRTAISLAALVDIGIRVVVRMPLRATRLRAVDGRCRDRATEKILESRRWVQVLWIDAESIAAQMIELFARFDWPYKQLIAKPMRAYVATTEADLRVRAPRASAARSASPRPTRRVASTVAHLAHRLKARNDRLERHSRVSCICLAFSMASFSTSPTAWLLRGS